MDIPLCLQCLKASAALLMMNEHKERRVCVMVPMGSDEIVSLRHWQTLYILWTWTVSFSLLSFFLGWGSWSVWNMLYNLGNHQLFDLPACLCLILFWYCRTWREWCNSTCGTSLEYKVCRWSFEGLTPLCGDTASSQLILIICNWWANPSRESR